MKLIEGDDLHNHLGVLAGKAMSEPWKADDPEAKEYTEEYSILRSYIRHTSNKLKEGNKILISDNKDFASYNTGLVTKYYEDIYAVYKKSKSSDNYFLKGFFKESEIELRSNFANKLPETANYFEHPERLLYNPKRKLFPNYDHILNDNKDR